MNMHLHLLCAIILVTAAYSEPFAVPLCAKMGITAAITKAPLATCKEFYSGPVAIKAPKDTDAIKFGAIWSQEFNTEDGVTFYNRLGRAWNVPSRLLPKSLLLTDQKTVSQMLFSASFCEGNVTKLTPILFIIQTTMMLPFRNTQYVGTVTNLAPLPEGIPTTAWFRWDIGFTFKKYALTQFGSGDLLALAGTFVNLFNATKDGSACRPALCTNNATTSWYEIFAGSGTELLFYWSPAMHAAMDSELVPVFSNGVSYMAALPKPYELLASNVPLSTTYRITIHGTPVGAVFQYVGKFSKLGPVTSC